MIKEATGHKADNIMDLTELVVGIGSAKAVAKTTSSVFAKASSELRGALNKAKGVTSTVSSEVRATAKFLRRRIRSQLAKINPRRTPRVRRPVETAKLPGFEKSPTLKPNIQLFGEKIGAKTFNGTRNPKIDFAGKTKIGGERLTDHLFRHGKDFGFRTETEYLEGARKFLEKPLTSTTESFTSSEGWYFRYDTATNEFGIINNKGGISTYYKPNIPNYWAEQIEKFAPK